MATSSPRREGWRGDLVSGYYVLTWITVRLARTKAGYGPDEGTGYRPDRTELLLPPVLLPAPVTPHWAWGTSP